MGRQHGGEARVAEQVAEDAERDLQHATCVGPGNCTGAKGALSLCILGPKTLTGDALLHMRVSLHGPWHVCGAHSGKVRSSTAITSSCMLCVELCNIECGKPQPAQIHLGGQEAHHRQSS